MSARFERVALIGLGLIAGSMAHAMRAGGLAGRITGHARSAETRATAAEIGLVDEVFDTAVDEMCAVFVASRLRCAQQQVRHGALIEALLAPDTP
mgnify:CR=1 FL=1